VWLYEYFFVHLKSANSSQSIKLRKKYPTPGLESHLAEITIAEMPLKNKLDSLESQLYTITCLYVLCLERGLKG
jgi:hypothetical protein